MKRWSDGTIWALAISVGAVAIAAACGGGPSNRELIRGGGGGAAGGAGGLVLHVDPATAGTISGTVKFDGQAPEQKIIDTAGNPDCTRVFKEKILEERMVVNPNGTVRWCFLALDVSDKYAAPSEPVVIDQQGCRYVPHVTAVMAGQPFVWKSSDQTSHNVHWFGKANSDGDNFAMVNPSERKYKDGFPLPEETWVRVKCDIHSWMGAYIGVKSHPFFAVSDENGAYTIKNVPPGTYTLILRHELLGEQKAQVTVATGKTTTQDFTLAKKS